MLELTARDSLPERGMLDARSLKKEQEEADEVSSAVVMCQIILTAPHRKHRLYVNRVCYTAAF